MINLQYSKKAFENYLNDYDRKNEKIKLKIVHTYGVMECSKKIAEDMRLPAEDCELAQLIGLLHDIGRFEQLKCYNSFEPGTMDHAAFGVKILFEERLIRRFVEEDKWDEIIKRAIGHHSDYCLKEITNERELMHAQIIRDADKLDNCRVKLETAIETLLGVTAEQVGMSEITPEVMQQFKNHKSILLKTRKTKMDYWISYLAYFYDINFKATYVDKMIQNGKEYVLAHGNVSGHKRLIDTMHIHTSEIQSITINKNTEELIIATRNTEYYCPLEYCKWEQQDENADLIPEYNWIKKHYRNKLDIPEIDEDKVLLTLSNFDKYYYHSAYCKLSSEQESVSFRAYPHIGMLQDSFTISGDGSLIKLSYFPHPKNIQFYCESTAEMPLFVENIGNEVLYVDTHSGLIKLVPGERKEVKVENIEQEEQSLSLRDLYPAEIIE